jgi:DNA-binding CsgD family transcriptional regulator
MATLGVTPREAEVLAFLAEGRSTREIAARLYVSPKTVERHIANLAAKVADAGFRLVSMAAAPHTAPAVERSEVIPPPQGDGPRRRPIRIGPRRPLCLKNPVVVA